MNKDTLQILKSFDSSLKKKAVIIFLISLMIVPLEFLSIAAVIPLFSSIFESTSTNSVIDFSFLEINFFGENRVANALIFIITTFFFKKFVFSFLFQKKVQLHFFNSKTNIKNDVL